MELKKKGYTTYAKFDVGQLDFLLTVVEDTIVELPHTCDEFEFLIDLRRALKSEIEYGEEEHAKMIAREKEKNNG